MTSPLLRSILLALIVSTLILHAGGQSQASVREPVRRLERPATNGASLHAPVVSPAVARGGKPASLTVDSRHRSLLAIKQVFQGRAAAAIRVARCESQLHASAISRTGDYGLFQLHRSVWDPARNPRARPYWPRGKDWRHVFDPVVNARVAWAISKRGTDFWTHWRWSAGCWA